MEEELLVRIEGLSVVNKYISHDAHIHNGMCVVALFVCM